MSKDIDLTKLYDPTTNSKQILAHSVPETYILYGGAFGGGKTACLVNEAIRLSLEYPGNVGYLCRYQLSDFQSSTLLQLEKFIPPELVAIHHKTENYMDVIAYKKGDKVITSRIYYGGLKGDQDTKTKINSMELGWFGVDQAEEISEKMFLLLAGRLRLLIDGKSPKYKGFLTCNPAPGWLWDRFIEKSQPDHRFIAALWKDNARYLPEDYARRLYQIYPENLAKRMLEGQWDVDMEGNRLIPYSEIRAAIERNLAPEGDKIAGVDISRYGESETVFLLRQGPKVLHIEGWKHQDLEWSVGRIARLIREHKPVQVRIDAVGIGWGVVDPLKNSEENFPIKAINVGEAPLDKEIYWNKRAEYYGLLAKRFRDGNIDIPDHPQLASELASLKYKFHETKFLMESKEEMRRRGEKSPDYADALMLAFSGGDNVFRANQPINTLTFRSHPRSIRDLILKK